MKIYLIPGGGKSEPVIIESGIAKLGKWIPHSY
jgi:hypothetical protein